MKFRFWALVSFFTLMYGVLVFNLYSLQVRNGDFYVARAESQLLAGAGMLTAPRGTIFFADKEGNFVPAAVDKEYKEIYAVPTEVEDAEEGGRTVAMILGLPVEETVIKFKKAGDQYELLVKKATEEQLAALSEAGKMSGIYSRKYSSRFYPLGTAAAQLIGFTAVNKENNTPTGAYGIERYFETRLAGVAGRTEGDFVERPIRGKDVYLSIDRNIQSQAEETLTSLAKRFSASGGTVIVEDPKTGRILAMANYPLFNPNSYSSYNLGVFQNQAVESVYEPGSVFKIITMSAGIDSGKITPETVYYDSGEVKLNGRTIRNWDLKAYGRQTMTGVIEHSLNTGTVFAERQMGRDIFREYLERFQIDEATGISLPGEVEGSLGAMVGASPQDVNFATASFGQGVSVTPIGLLTAAAAIANRGVMMRPILEVNEQPQEVGRIISEETARKVTAMMVSAVDGAMVAKISGYTVAGKTGTAQVPDFKRGGYTEQYIHTYIGFVPAYDPKFIVMIKLDKPSAILAGQTVVPAFKELAQFIINYYNIAPDRIDK